MRFIFAALLMLFPMVAQAGPTDGSQPTTVKGDVLYWEGDELIVKEMSGREVRVRVTAQTKIEGAAGKLKTGDKIEASVTSEGHATSIALQIPDSGPTSVLPGSR